MYTKVIENFNNKYNNNNNFINDFFTKIIKVNNNSDRFKIKNKEYYIIKDKFTITNNLMVKIIST